MSLQRLISIILAALAAISHVFIYNASDIIIDLQNGRNHKRKDNNLTQLNDWLNCRHLRYTQKIK